MKRTASAAEEIKAPTALPSLARARLSKRRSINSHADGPVASTRCTTWIAHSRLATFTSTRQRPPGSGIVFSVASVKKVSVPSDPINKRGKSSV